MPQVDQKRIAKNTMLLYLRMGLIMLISLYTSRVVLDSLGKVDFGLYGAVGGIVVVFSFLNSVLSSACTRYFSVELGHGDHSALSRLFSLNISIFVIFSLIVLVISETFGLWFVNNKMVFPPERETAVNLVFQFSVLSCLFSMISTPYRAMIIAREKMKVFAYSSVVEVILRLVAVLLLASSGIDRLVLYSALMMAVTAGISGFFVLYCSHYYPECRFRMSWDSGGIREIIGYTGWNVVGSVAGIGRSQGVNIILNMFFGPVVNAARTVAYQVYSNIFQFVQNFVTAFNPQIMKSYAAGEGREMMKLVFQSSKFSYFLLFLFVLPVSLEAQAVLDIWLKEVPDNSALYMRLILIASLVDSLGNPIISSIQATGRVKWYQICVGGVLLLVPVSAYLMFKFGDFRPESVFYVSIAASVLAQVLRTVFMKRQLGMDVNEYLKAVIWPVVMVSVTSLSLPFLLLWLVPAGLLRSLLVIAVSMLSVAASVMSFGVTESERRHIIAYLFRRRER